jgi:curved DNA-binding protein CbpA
MLAADPEKESPYQVLQVRPTASRREVDEAFRRTSSKDQRIKDAYRVLQDVQERLKVDIFQLVLEPDSTPGSRLKKAFQGFDPASLLDMAIVDVGYVRLPEEGSPLWPRPETPELPVGDAKGFSLAPAELPDVSFDR